MTQHLLFAVSQLAFGPSKYADAAVNLIYWLILFASVYGGAIKIGVGRFAAFFAIVFIAVCPLVVVLSRQPLLDFGNLALLSAAFYCMMGTTRHSTWREIVLLALILAIAGTAKQTSFLWLAGFFVWRLIALVFRKQFDANNFGKLFIMGLPLAGALLLWLLPNSDSLISWKNYYYPQAAKGNTFIITLAEHLWSYATFWPAIISPLLLLLVVAGFGYLVWAARQRLKPLYELAFASALGLVTLSALSVNRPEPRYEIPIVYLLALVVAMSYQAAVDKDDRLGKAFIAIAKLVTCLAIVQYFVFSFVPYPIPGSPAIAKFIEAVIGRGEAEPLDPAGYPTRGDDAWGIDWLASSIKKAGLPLNRLNILSSTREVSVHGLEVAALRRKLTLEVSTFRRFTLHGDVFEYNDDQIPYYNWYLLKTGEQGFALADKKSIDAYNELENTIRTSGNFRLVGSRSLPDKSRYDLYVAIR